jgi:hypothetical protein
MSLPRTRAAALAATLLLTALLVAIAPPASATAQAPDRPAASAQVVLDWQRTALRTVYTENATPVPVGPLYLGFTSLAIRTAVERAERAGHTSARAAAAVAAHNVLKEYFPASAATLHADLATSLGALPPGPATWRGIWVGARAAAALIADRTDDGRNDPSYVYSKPPAPGVWQPPPTGMAAPWLGFTDSLVLDTHLPVDGPDPLTSAAYARDYDPTWLKLVRNASGVDGADRFVEALG